MTHFQSQCLHLNNYIKTLGYQTSSSVHASPFGKETMSTRDLSFEKILEERPTLHELCEHVRIGPKWYILGVMLKMDTRKLYEIEDLSKPIPYKVSKVFELWLDTNPYATRRQILDALKMNTVGQYTLAHMYEQNLRSSFSK